MEMEVSSLYDKSQQVNNIRLILMHNNIIIQIDTITNEALVDEQEREKRRACQQELD